MTIQEASKLSIERRQMLVLNKDGEAIGTKDVFITRDFMYYVNTLNAERRELVLVKPILED